MRVLVVEDDLRLAGLVRRGLTADGFAVQVCHDGNQGLALGKARAFDAIVLDIMLPGRNGYRVCADLRAAQVWTPILMLTAKDGVYDEAEGLDTGADDYLTKPFSYVVLVARLRALIRRGQAARPALLTAGDLTLDPATRRCHRGPAEIRLTSKEFQVLECLLRRREEVVSRAEVIEAVWDSAEEPAPNLVEVYISALRRKIDAPFGRRSITTIRSVGYRLGADGGA
ncbi:response regulator transcription factor [Crossiella cryophila]|uniref:DNA-binding response OmpR family regulator n=1 Tax=Crossiella cryophila TaxID=43355 RepID=A0A7W7FZ36_9PSEU|nr:response regulator transcription factor [Crossiella cryophila]MBB4680739.1 DNA-binding response OmpR family regulator [Crossiella cryophila]